MQRNLVRALRARHLLARLYDLAVLLGNLLSVTVFSHRLTPRLKL